MSEYPQSLAKLSVPRLHDAVARERLFAILDGLHASPAVWVAGPPGAGKTTLLAGWLAARSKRALWYHLDAGDADAATFFYYLRLAAKPAQRRRRPLPLLTPEFQADLPGFARRFFRELFARLEPGQLLVLDDVHAIPRHSPLLPALAEAVEEVPRHLQLVLVGREEPDDAFSRLLANRSLTVVGGETLLLTESEAQAMTAARIELDAARMDELYRMSGGWAAGLSLIAERIRRGLPGAMLSELDTHQAVFDYFSIEIFARATPEVRETLLRLCYFPRFTAEQARTIAGNDQVERLLDSLYRRHLFVERRTAAAERTRAEPVYQFHALFQAFLRRQAAAALSPAELTALACDTARMLDSCGESDYAIPLYLDAENWQAASQLIRRHAQSFLQQGRGKLLGGWIARLPDGVRSADPNLLYWAGAIDAAVQPAAARTTLEQAFRAAVDQQDRICQVECAAAIVETILLEYTAFDALDRWIAILEQAVHERIRFTDVNGELRVYAALVGSVCHRQGSPPTLHPYVARTFELLWSDADASLRLTAATYLLKYGTCVGDMEVVRQVLPWMERLLEHEDAPPLARALGELFVGWSYVNLLDDERTWASIARLDRLAEVYGLPHTRRFGAIVGYWISLLRMRGDKAQQWLAYLQQTADPNQPYNAAAIAAMRAWLLVSGGPAASAFQAAQEAVQRYDVVGSSWHRLFARGMRLWALVELGDVEGAQRCIDELRGLTEQFHLDVFGVYVHQASAILALRRCDETALEASLATLFTAAAKCTAAMPARFFSSWMPTLCAEALGRGIEVAYVRRLIQQFGWRCVSGPIEQWPWRVRIYTLGRFAIYVDDRPLAFVGRAPKKTLNLLKALICLGGTEVRDHRLIDAIWPDDEADAARAAFSVALHRLRKLLDCADAIRVEEGLVSIDPALCWVDALAFEQLCERRNARAAEGSEGNAGLGLYHGPLLPAEQDQAWSASLRGRLRARYIREVLALGERHERAARFHEALELYASAVRVEELIEAFHHGLIRCHLALGRPAEAAAAYARVQELWRAAMGTTPSAESQRLQSVAVAAARHDMEAALNRLRSIPPPV